jgi:hypothetical protein
VGDAGAQEEQHKRELMAMNSMVMRMSQPICFSGSGQAGTGGGDEDSALAVPDGWTGAFGKYLVHEPILGIGEYQVRGKERWETEGVAAAAAVGHRRVSRRGRTHRASSAVASSTAPSLLSPLQPHTPSHVSAPCHPHIDATTSPGNLPMHINHRGLTHLAPANIASIATCSASLASSILRCVCRCLRWRSFSFLPPPAGCCVSLAASAEGSAACTASSTALTHTVEEAREASPATKCALS